MKSALKCFLRGKIGRQITVLVITSLVLAHLVMTAAFLLINPTPPVRGGDVGSIQRLVFVARMLDAEADPQMRAKLVAAAQRADFALSLLPTASAVSAANRRFQRDWRSVIDGNRRFLLMDEPASGTQRSRPMVVAELADGSRLASPLPAPPAPPDGALSAVAVVTLLSLASAVAVLSWWAARQIVAPLAQFADAAERFSTRGSNAPLVESGPLEVRHAARALNDMQQRVLKLIADRTQMLAAVGHDLRTPITRLRLRAEQIENEELRVQVLRDLATMQNLVQVALSFLRGQFAPCAAAKTDLPPLVQTVCDGFVDIGGKVSYSGPPHLYIDCEPEQLMRAVANLIENGLKFGTSVAVRVMRRDDRAAIEIEDDGPGIADAEKRFALEPFYRGDSARNLDAGDSFGLGLSIAQTAVERSGGTIELLDAGSTGLLVRLLLPITNRDTL